MPDSTVLPTDQFDKLLERLIGLPGGAHTQPSVVQSRDFYGNSTNYFVQTVRTEDGATVFIQQVSAASGPKTYILPPAVLRVIDRQRETTTTQIRRRHGKRLAEERGLSGKAGGFTPEMRAKALETRRRKAAARKKKR